MASQALACHCLGCSIDLHEKPSDKHVLVGATTTNIYSLCGRSCLVRDYVKLAKMQTWTRFSDHTIYVAAVSVCTSDLREMSGLSFPVWRLKKSSWYLPLLASSSVSPHRRARRLAKKASWSSVSATRGDTTKTIERCSQPFKQSNDHGNTASCHTLSVTTQTRRCPPQN